MILRIASVIVLNISIIPSVPWNSKSEENFTISIWTC